MYLKIFIVVTLFLVLLIVGCTDIPDEYYLERVNTDDPMIQKAINKCGIGGSSDVDCYSALAVENRKPDICLLANPSIDDWCVEIYYADRDTVDACEEIKSVKAGLYSNCLKHFEK